jgi:GMP synthase-like glutamine amidotransferase
MRILVFQHGRLDHPAVFREFWAGSGVEWVRVDFTAGEAIPELEGFDLLFVTGGAMMVWEEDEYPWLTAEKATIRRWVVDLKRPYFGICLGHQLLSDALGGEVTLMKEPEFGLSNVKLNDAGLRDPLFSGFSSHIESFQWHAAQISMLPKGGTVLASSPACPVQAMRWGTHAYGVQYHCEITAESLSDWQQLPAFRESIEAVGIKDAALFYDEVGTRFPTFRSGARQLNDALLRTVVKNNL